MYIHLPGRHSEVNLFLLQAFVSVLRTKYSKFVHILFFFWVVSRRYGATSLTSPACLYCLELYLDRLFPIYQQNFFCQQVFWEDLSSFLARVSGIAVSSEFKFLDARNLTCLQPLPNTLYINYLSLKHCSFRSV